MTIDNNLLFGQGITWTTISQTDSLAVNKAEELAVFLCWSKMIFKLNFVNHHLTLA